MALEPSEDEYRQAVEEGNVEWILTVVRWFHAEKNKYKNIAEKRNKPSPGGSESLLPGFTKMRVTRHAVNSFYFNSTIPITKNKEKRCQTKSNTDQ